MSTPVNSPSSTSTATPSATLAATTDGCGLPGRLGHRARRRRRLEHLTSTSDQHERVLRRASDLDPDPAYLSEAGTRQLADAGRRHRARPALPAGQCRLPGPRQRPARRCWCARTVARPARRVRTYFPGYQFWTSRGFARAGRRLRRQHRLRPALPRAAEGSLGHRRRRRLLRRCGVPRRAAGSSTRSRMAIRGGSAGGFTTLAALAFRDTFAAGASYFGVGDLAMLARDTHKFESRYLDGLVGPYPQAEDHLPGALAAAPRRRVELPDHPAPGRGGPGGPAQPGARDGRRAAGQGPARRADRISRRGSRIPHGGERSFAPRRRN